MGKRADTIEKPYITHPNGKQIIRWAKREVFKHEVFIEKLMLSACSERQIESLCAQELGLKTLRTRILRHRILERWKLAGAAESETNRIQAQRRIQRNITDVHSEFAADIPKMSAAAKHSALARYESILIQLQGTSAPIQINMDVTVSANLQGVIANLTPEQTQKYITRAKERALKAAEYDRLHGNDVPDAAE
jgi:hypothetical protein